MGERVSAADSVGRLHSPTQGSSGSQAVPIGGATSASTYPIRGSVPGSLRRSRVVEVFGGTHDETRRAEWMDGNGRATVHAVLGEVAFHDEPTSQRRRPIAAIRIMVQSTVTTVSTDSAATAG